MKKIAVFPGSFDPVTKGHENIIIRSIPLFDEIIVAIGENSSKNYFFNIKDRINFLNKVFEKNPTISIKKYNGLTIDFCKKNNAKYLLRGLRTSADFEFERSIGQMNKKMASDIETVFMLTLPEYTPISSSVVRDIIRNKGNISLFVPESIVEDIINY